jgi:hypothetical protein
MECSQIENGVLGSPPGMEMLKEMRPRYWFAAHHHVKYAASLRHPVERETATPGGPAADPLFTNTMTDFLALDKCLPRRQFVQVWPIMLPCKCAKSREISDPPPSPPPPPPPATTNAPVNTFLQFPVTLLDILRTKTPQTTTGNI